MKDARNDHKDATTTDSSARWRLAMLDPAHPITPFFDHDPERVLGALAAIGQSGGKVSSRDTLYRAAGESQLRGYRDGCSRRTSSGRIPLDSATSRPHFDACEK